MKHKFTSEVAQGADPTLVGPDQWNDVHAYGITSLDADTTLDLTHDFVRATAGASGITLTLPSAVGIEGHPYKIKRVDNGAGDVTIAAAGTETIDGVTEYLLVNQNQWVELVSDGANWMIGSAN